MTSCPLGIPLFHPSPPYAEPAFLPYSRLSVTCLVHVGQPCSFVVLALCLLHIDVFVPGSLFTYRCTLARELMANSSQNGRQIFVLVFAESRSSLEKMSKWSWNISSHSIATFMENSIYYQYSKFSPTSSPGSSRHSKWRPSETLANSALKRPLID